MYYKLCLNQLKVSNEKNIDIFVMDTFFFPESGH